MITAEQVTQAYELFLGRPPENADVVNQLCQNVHSLSKLRDVFVQSPEFAKAMAAQLGTAPPAHQRHPFHLPRMPVETQVTGDQLQQMFERIQGQWEQLGQTEPYWSVVTQPQYKQDQIEANIEPFYASGHHSCQLLLATLRRAGINPASLDTCLDVGCGVGRITAYLAGAFSRVLAADISGQHLAIARRHLADKGVNNVDLQHWARPQDLLSTPPVDLIYSVITLQHNPPPVMAWMLTQLLQRLKPGGAAYLQIPTYRNGYLFEVERYLNSPPTNGLEMHFLPQADVFALTQAEGCDCMEVREDGMVGDEDKMLSNTFLFQKRSH